MAVLEERSRIATNKAKDLVAEIQEVKRRLTNIKACIMAGMGNISGICILVNMYIKQTVACCFFLSAAQALISVQASKSKRNQGKQ